MASGTCQIIVSEEWREMEDEEDAKVWAEGETRG